jgi:ribosomal protein S18 acetylase RimI-like enzyme
MNRDKLQIRKFNKEDTLRCSELAADAWPIVSTWVPKKDVVKFMHSYVEIYKLQSTWLEVACISGNIVGFLFGRVNTDYKMIAKIKAFFSILAIGIKIISGRYGNVSKPFTLLWKFDLNELKVKRNTPKSDGEVVLFVVDSKYRGRGIGKVLMDRFMETAKNKNANVISVYTNTEANWRFYEKYGFKKYSAFYDDLTSYFKNEEVKGFVYTIGIQHD